MSKSRLEKFLYALYSIDSSDLPNPLSRIEELYKCLVTGEEVPSFKPTSRVEKYLMAILGGYDVDSLPNPLSRVEVLLYKLATGDDNLDDVKSFLSEHEELLAEIIRNGGVGGNIDIEYVLYTLSTEFNTLYNTAEKPVKSAILKGKTLVNIADKRLQNIEKTATNGSTTTIYGLLLDKMGYEIAYPLIANKEYLIIEEWNIKSSNDIFHTAQPKIRYEDDTVSYLSSGGNLTTLGVHKLTRKFIPEKNVKNFYFGLTNKAGNTVSLALNYAMIIEYQQGMENWDIPYFTGMSNVKMPVLTTWGGENQVDLSRFYEGFYWNGEDKTADENAWTHDYFIKVNPSTKYYYNVENGSIMVNYTNFYDENKNYITRVLDRTNFTTPINCHFIRISLFDITLFEKLSLTENNKHEPYKSNILTVNEPVELRGIGDVKDELDLITGELTQHIGEVVLDGSEEHWGLNALWSSDETDYCCFYNSEITKNIIKVLSADKLSAKSANELRDYETNLAYSEGIRNDIGNIQIFLAKSKLSTVDVNGLKQYLQSNPITVQYQLATESVKTVDLSVVDQDGDNTKLSTFNDITHVTLSSEGLIPEAELEVATKNEEVLNTMSLEMDDIYAAQTTLDETSNTQSENVDATMIATTEIYEGLL